FHYFALKALARHLDPQLKGQKLLACFSQNKNELVLEFEAQFLRIGCNTPLTYIIPVGNFSQARKNVVQLFEEIAGLTVEGVTALAYERVMQIHLTEDYVLILKMHGHMANVILRREGQPIALFNQQLEADKEWEIAEGPWSPEALPTEVEPDLKIVQQALRQVSPVFEKQMARHVLRGVQAGDSFVRAFDKMIEAAENEQYHLILEPNRVRFLLVEPDPGKPFITFEGIEPALQAFLRCHFQFNSYRAQYKSVAQVRKKPYEKYKKVYTSYQDNIRQLEAERSLEELGHILMANLHAIPPQTNKVELDDFYGEGKVSIKLDPRKSPQENAERLYTKHKSRRSKLAYLRDQLEEIEEKKVQAEVEWEALAELPSPQELTLGPKGLDPDLLKKMKQLARATSKEVKAAQAESSPYRTFKRSGYEIFVGRNARNSDELSFKYANKEDLWLHVKDVPGSHVIIRQRAGQSIPEDVLEYAASLAAFYSKRKKRQLKRRKVNQR
ncbi:MAG: NFACT RNA binding domain-containing protein, partial [Bacteroidota bacterium]